MKTRMFACVYNLSPGRVETGGFWGLTRLPAYTKEQALGSLRDLVSKSKVTAI